MPRNPLIIAIILLFAIETARAADTASSKRSLSAAEIVNRNVNARGGLQAWRAVTALEFEGKLGAGGNQRATLTTPIGDKKTGPLPTDPRPKEEVQLPFVLEMERPRKVRFELQFKGQTALQVFDGELGWKLRPYLNRREVEPYTSQEIKAAQRQAELDGQLIDYTAKGTKIEVDGVEKVEDRDAYKLKLSLKNGQVVHLWVDAKTFLETKIEGEPRKLDGIDHPVEIYYRDYRSVSGLQIPFLLETTVLPVSIGDGRKKESPIPSEKIIMDKVTINPPLDAKLFQRPTIETASVAH